MKMYIQTLRIDFIAYHIIVRRNSELMDAGKRDVSHVS